MLQGVWRALCGEALGTLLLVGVGCAALGGGAPLTHGALAFGGLVAALVAALGEVSGAHLNPAVTVAALVAGRLGPRAAAGWVAAQVAGAVAGAALLRPLGSEAARAAVTVPAAGLPAAAAVAVEAALTAVLALLACELWRQHCPARPDHSAPLKLGAAVAALIYSGGALTGASMNPARSLGPALVAGVWTRHWVYWVGPLLGAALVAAVHRWVLTTPATATATATATTPPPPEHAELQPLRNKEDC